MKRTRYGSLLGSKTSKAFSSDFQTSLVSVSPDVSILVPSGEICLIYPEDGKWIVEHFPGAKSYAEDSEEQARGIKTILNQKPSIICFHNDSGLSWQWHLRDIGGCERGEFEDLERVFGHLFPGNLENRGALFSLLIFCHGFEKPWKYGLKGDPDSPELDQPAITPEKVKQFKELLEDLKRLHKNRPSKVPDFEKSLHN